MRIKLNLVKKLFRDRIISITFRLRIVLKSIQKFDSHVKFFLIVVSFQAASASCYYIELFLKNQVLADAFFQSTNPSKSNKISTINYKKIYTHFKTFKSSSNF